MSNYIIAIDQSTSATKALLFDDQCQQLAQCSLPHQQYYPRSGWVEHDAEEIYRNTVEAIKGLTPGPSRGGEGSIYLEPRETAEKVTTPLPPAGGGGGGATGGEAFSLSITNQRETIVVWDRESGKPVCHALVWQDTRGTELCNAWREQGLDPLVQERSGLKIDPNFCASKIRWILDNIEGAREKALDGTLLAGTIDCWLVWKLTGGKVFATDYTNASRTMLFNIHTLTWDADLARALDIPLQMLPEVRPCDALYGETTVEGLFAEPIKIAGVLGDSHGALAGQMCFREGMGKVTYGTGSSVMINIGTKPQPAPTGLVTSIGFSIQGTTYYAFEGNIYSTGATLKWLTDQVHLIDNPAETEALATSVEDNGGVYLVPAFAGLGAPWWQSGVKGALFGMTFNTTRAHIARAALESIAYQIKDLVDAMLSAKSPSPESPSPESPTPDPSRGGEGSIYLEPEETAEKVTTPLPSAGGAGGGAEFNADGGPTRNAFLMQLQADLLGTDIVCTKVEDASALGAAVIGGFALGLWKRPEEVSRLKVVTRRISPSPTEATAKAYAGWREAVGQLIKK